MKGGKNKPGAGRKWFDGKNEEAVLTQLRIAWSLGAPDAEAASLAEISTASLSRYLSSHPIISEQKERLLKKPYLSCRNALLKQITAGDGDLALKFMERKLKKEFGQNVDITGDLSLSLEQLITKANDDKEK